jgi:hypothetical protein
MKASAWLGFAVLACVAGCKSDDEDAPASCDGCACEDYCVELCQHVDSECGGISLKECTRGCFDFEPEGCETAAIEGRRCEYLQDEAGCYEAIGGDNGECFTSDHTPPGVCSATDDRCRDGDLCNEELGICEPCNEDSCDGYCSSGRCVECLETDQCGATQECVAEACRERCNDNVPCRMGQMCWAEGVCSDPIGKPCDPDAFDFETCYGGMCVNENASLMTVPAYCTFNCFSDTCPPGYTCSGSKCLQE